MSALRRSGIVDSNLDVLPTAGPASVITSGAALPEEVDGGNPADRIPKAPASNVGGSQDETPAKHLNLRTGNPYAISERNGIRVYQLITVNPDHPGPQTNNKARYYIKTGSTKKRARQGTIRHSSIIDLDSDCDSQASHQGSEEAEQAPERASPMLPIKKRRTDVEALRAMVVKMQAELEEAEHLEALEKSKTQQMERDLEKELNDLATQQTALVRQLKHAKAQAQSYKKRQAELRKIFDEIASLRETMARIFKGIPISGSSNADELIATKYQESADDGLAEYYHGPGTKHSHSVDRDTTEPGAKGRSPHR
ncbi:MAG: hypothetical protein Q9191_003744 [Dirinaria sp. TL-2023a]